MELESELVEIYHEANEVLFPNRIDPLTFDEFHSLVLGLTGFWLGRGRRPGVAFTLALVALVGPHSDHDGPLSAGLGTITEEPWYFIAALAASYALGRVLQ